MDVAVIRTGTANIASMMAALRRLGAEPVLTADPDVIRSSERVVLPGVGAFAAALEQLREVGAADAIAERAAGGRPLLAVCLGLQMLARASDESPGVTGLGILEVDVTQFGDSAQVPQLGWNRVTPTTGSRLVVEGYAYYANSFRLAALPDGWEGAWSIHGDRFVAAAERGDVLACQFHPELSARWGHELLGRWLRATGASC
jgi:imidazole glycerol phosphate synthase glutamine amidotransferase subunit